MHISGRSASRLARPAPPIDRWTSTCGPFSWTDIGSPWPDVARNLSLLAPREAHPGSDVDLLVDFEPGASLLDHVGLFQDLEELLGVGVDVVTRSALKPRDDNIRAEAVDL